MDRRTVKKEIKKLEKMDTVFVSVCVCLSLSLYIYIYIYIVFGDALRNSYRLKKWTQQPEFKTR